MALKLKVGAALLVRPIEETTGVASPFIADEKILHPHK
jgi:hypothetical protein